MNFSNLSPLEYSPKGDSPIKDIIQKISGNIYDRESNRNEGIKIKTDASMSKDVVKSLNT